MLTIIAAVALCTATLAKEFENFNGPEVGRLHDQPDDALRQAEDIIDAVKR